MPDTTARRLSGSEIEAEIDGLLRRLFPLMRSLTGPGVRATHDILAEVAPLERIEIPSGTQVFDWTVPKEWLFREAYVVGPDGRRVIDSRNHNLHVVNYAAPFRGTVTRAELERHLHSLPDQPQAIPYVTSYYQPTWGFCLTQAQRDALPEGDYEVVVDSALIDGSMTLAEAVLPGSSQREVLFSSYTCHPSMANDELCAPIALALLLRALAARPSRRLTYRFVFLPETIGSIAYLARRGEHLKAHLAAGFTLANIGHAVPFRLKRSRRGNSLSDRRATALLQSERWLERAGAPRVMPFEPLGSDERQYCSPGFDLPVAALTRGDPGFAEYHTSLDDLDSVSSAAVAETVELLLELCDGLERSRVYRNTQPFCEPQLGKRGLYPSTGSRNDRDERVKAILWTLNAADGTCDLHDIAERSGLPFAQIAEAAENCAAAGLLEEV